MVVNNMKAYVNNKIIGLDSFDYAITSISKQSADLGNRYIIEILINKFLELISDEFNKVMESYSSVGGCDIDYIDNLKNHTLEFNLKKNDLLFNKYLITDHVDLLFDKILSFDKRSKVKVIISSFDGIFTNNCTVFLYGGCKLS